VKTSNNWGEFDALKNTGKAFDKLSTEFAV
jgi:hypothetical protein